MGAGREPRVGGRWGKGGEEEEEEDGATRGLISWRGNNSHTHTHTTTSGHMSYHISKLIHMFHVFISGK